MKSKENKVKEETGIEPIWYQVSEFLKNELDYINATAEVSKWYHSTEEDYLEPLISQDIPLKELIIPYLREMQISEELANVPILAILKDKIKTMQEINTSLPQNEALKPHELRSEIARFIKTSFESNSQSALDCIDMIVNKRIQNGEYVFSNILTVKNAIEEIAGFEIKAAIIKPIQNYVGYKTQLQTMIKNLNGESQENMNNMLRRVAKFNEQCNAVSKLTEQIEDMDHKLRLLNFIFTGTDVFLENFRHTLSGVLQNLYAQNNINFIQIPRIEPHIRYLQSALAEISGNKNIDDIKEICDLVVEHIEKASMVKPIPAGSPQAQVIEIIKKYQGIAFFFPHYEQIVMDKLQPLEKYFKQEPGQIKQLEKKIQAYVKLLGEMKNILDGTMSPQDKLKSISSQIERVESQFDSKLGVLSAKPPLFSFLIKELRKNVTTENLDTLYISIQSALGKLASLEKPELSPSASLYPTSARKKENKKEKESDQENRFVYEDKNAVLLQILKSFSLGNMGKHSETNEGLRRFILSIEDVSEEMIKGNSLVEVSEKYPDSNLELLYMKGYMTNNLRDDLIVAYFNLDSTDPDQQMVKEQLEALHKICFKGKPLAMLGNFKTYLTNLDITNLPSKKDLLNDLGYFFKQEGCNKPYEIVYYLSQLYTSIQYLSDSDPSAREVLFNSLDVVNTHLYGKKCNEYLKELYSSRIEDRDWVEIKITPHKEPVEITLDAIREKFNTLFSSQEPIKESDVKKKSADFNHKFIDKINSLEKKYPLAKGSRPLIDAHYLEFFNFFSEYDQDKKKQRYPDKSIGKGGRNMYHFHKSESSSDSVFELAKCIFKNVVENPEKHTNIRHLLDDIPEKYKPRGGIKPLMG